MTENQNFLALHGVRVIDFSRVPAAPMAPGLYRRGAPW